ncbi:MAG: Cof-type HAD-IIB family hydrolase, partial [Clostridia bacterium]|nr:Cof-type HAD-IIB family hydrolase [Clostridia bacterium]
MNAKKSKIRMVGLDLDGTVFNEAKNITDYTKEVLERAMEQGVVVLPATGRPECGLPREMLDIPGIKYALTSNGARVIELSSGRTIYSELIPCEVTLRALQLMNEWDGCVWEVYFDGKVCVEEGRYRFLRHPDMTPALIQYMYDSRVPVKNLFQKIEKEKIGMEKIHMVFEDTKVRNEKMKILRDQFPELDISCATTFNIEINSSKVGKGIALLELGKLLGIRKEEIMACGDASND